MAALTYPAIDPVAFALGPAEVRWYGLAYLAGFLLGLWVLWALNKRWSLGLSGQQAMDILLAGALSILVGGRVGYVLFYNLDYYLEDFTRVAAIWDGGMSFHGALAGILLAAWWMSRRLDMSFLRLTDLGAVGAPLGLFFGRLANFVNGELWGRTTDVAWGMVFPGAGPLPRHPSQIYEALLEGAVLFAVLWLLSRRMRPRGTYMGVFMAGYGLSRFIVEFFREPDAQLGFVLGPFSMGQLLTVPMVVAGAWLVWSAYRRSRAASAAE